MVVIVRLLISLPSILTIVSESIILANISLKDQSCSKNDAFLFLSCTLSFINI